MQRSLLLLWWRTFQLEDWRTFQLVSTPAKVEQEEFDTVFSNTPMDIEVQAEYPQEEEEIEEEDISCIATGEAPPTAQGLDFDEMSNLIKVMRQKEDTPQELKMAVATIDKVRDTELFNKMVSSIGGEGLARIEAMFAKNESLPKEPPATEGFEDQCKNLRDFYIMHINWLVCIGRRLYL